MINSNTDRSSAERWKGLANFTSVLISKETGFSAHDELGTF